MRVLPRCGSNAPRLPLEKSYSALILFTFLSGCAARRYWANIVAAMGVRHNQHLTGIAHADGNKALFTCRVRILNMAGKPIFKHALGVGQRYLVFLQVRCCLVWVVLKAHVAIIYILYILVNLRAISMLSRKWPVAHVRLASNSNSITSSITNGPMQLWKAGVFTLDCDFGGHLGVAGFWVQRLPPKVPPERSSCEEFEQSEARAFRLSVCRQL